MTIVPLFLLTLGAINWGYAYPLVFLFVALLRQRMLGREIYFNFLYAPGFWLLLSAGMTYALIGMRTISGVYHHGVLPVVAFAIGWLIAEGSSDKQIRDGILALAAGFGTYATLNMLVNIGNNRYRLIDFWTGTYRAATGSGALNTLPISVAPYAVKFEKRLPVKIITTEATLSFTYSCTVSSPSLSPVLVTVTETEMVSCRVYSFWVLCGAE